MPDPNLKGNGIWCPACKGSGQGDAITDTFMMSDGSTIDWHDICPTCRGARRIALAPEEIARATVDVHHRNIDTVADAR